MADQDSTQDKTEEPTERRLEDAKKKGQVPRSKDLNTLLSLMAAAVAMLFLGQALITDLHSILSNGLAFNPINIENPEALYEQISKSVSAGLLAVVPLFVLFIIAAFLGPVSMGGWAFSLDSLAPKLEKLSPIKGFGRMFGLQSLVELFKALLKFLLVAAVAFLIIYYSVQEIISLGVMNVVSAMAKAGSLLLWSFIGFSAVLILIAMIDVPFQLWQHKDKLKMTKQEIRDEMKDSEGRPEVKSQIRRMQRQLSEQRMMDAVPMADVIITNPTHFAVALKYEDHGNGAPIVVAKGQDFMAHRIREVAMQHEVTIFEAPPLARALYGMVEVKQEIPQQLYKAVAQILAYVFQLRDSSITKPQKPLAPGYFDVPEQYRGEVI